MFFKRKTKNRRLEQDHVLDVKVRSDRLKPAQVRRVVLALSAGGLTVLILFLGWRGGELLLARLIYENPAFALDQIQVTTDGIISPEQLKKWSRVKPGENSLRLDLSAVKRDLELVPWVQSAAVERQLPNQLNIRVRERVPVAQIYGIKPKAKSGGYDPIIYQMDSTGYVMEPLDSKFRIPSAHRDENFLPLVTGGPTQTLRPFRQIEFPQLRAALRLVEEFDYSPMAGLAGLKKIDLSVPEILQVTTEHGAEVTLSIYDLETQFRRWRAAHDFGQRNGKAIAFLDLSIANNIPARWMDLSALPPVPVKPSKILRPKKRNV